MHVFRTVHDVREWRRSLEGSVGLVPTMGYLHQGHLSLVRAARRNDDVVLVSIFVNPAQFGPEEDFARYPRDEGRDLRLLEAERVDTVFAPDADEIYPPRYGTYVTVEGVADRLEGASRPAHFRGVSTVVAKLFNIIGPDRAYFGQKDAQQLAVVGRMVRDLNLPVEIVGMPIVREPDGLAMSSRNAYLGPKEREAALTLSRALTAARTMFEAGQRDASAIRKCMAAIVGAEPLAQADYMSVADAVTLDELDTIAGPALVSLAVRVGATRLIDNATLAPDGRAK